MHSIIRASCMPLSNEEVRYSSILELRYNPMRESGDGKQFKRLKIQVPKKHTMPERSDFTTPSKEDEQATKMAFLYCALTPRLLSYEMQKRLSDQRSNDGSSLA
ncbi:hypothetical protein DPSP01_001114 [Paraphaeosphaeria sporulosa]